MAPAAADRATGHWSRLPPGRNLQLRTGRTAFFREVPGPPGAPVLVLLHGLMLSADLNWFGAYDALGEHYRVIALDLPGHGHSPLRGRRPQLEECARDVAELTAALGITRCIVVGYSMGGLVAQLVWRQYPELVAGLVLCSTARNFRGSSLERMTSLFLPGLTSWMQLNPILHLIGSGTIGMNVLGHIEDPALAAWAKQQMERTSLATTVGAMEEVSRFTSHSWIGGVAIPSAVVVTSRDQVIPAARQRRLAAAIGAATVLEIDAGHGVCVTDPAQFAAVLRGACHSVATPSPVAR